MQWKMRRLSDTCWEIPQTERPFMRVPARVYADEALLKELQRDLTLEQAVNVTSLRGIYKYGVTLSDGHTFAR